MEWPKLGVTIEPHERGVLVTDHKVVGEESCYVARGWDLSKGKDRAEIERFIEACSSRGFVWALQAGHPKAKGRGTTGKPPKYLSFGRNYNPQPAWEIAVNNPSGESYVIAARHESCLLGHGIHYTYETGGGHNLLIRRPDIKHALDAIVLSQREWDAESAINDSGTTEKESLIKARIGQGVFRERVLKIEPSCRLTGVSDARFLRASHIKPWVHSTDAERLDGSNGLMLAPHVDHLFDLGFISFKQSGELLVAKGIEDLLEIWQLPRKALGEKFSDHQERYLAFHRQRIFKK